MCPSVSWWCHRGYMMSYVVMVTFSFIFRFRTTRELLVHYYIMNHWYHRMFSTSQVTMETNINIIIVRMLSTSQVTMETNINMLIVKDVIKYLISDINSMTISVQLNSFPSIIFSNYNVQYKYYIITIIDNKNGCNQCLKFTLVW